ncbi:unnamed protein product [Eruca vesicaria subsp. sativa]|uniref:Uncharacterized protein n=1 Tax=Eruca vesicaria subsp. sativa TaxID=29727 RepID=A0ABC8M2M1_ERUVS|nr:unnamed protein product [Eruca vesicaria subsp. sativa]
MILQGEISMKEKRSSTKIPVRKDESKTTEPSRMEDRARSYRGVVLNDGVVHQKKAKENRGYDGKGKDTSKEPVNPEENKIDTDVMDCDHSRIHVENTEGLSSGEEDFQNLTDGEMERSDNCGIADAPPIKTGNKDLGEGNVEKKKSTRKALFSQSLLVAAFSYCKQNLYLISSNQGIVQQHHFQHEMMSEFVVSGECSGIQHCQILYIG